MPKLWDSRKIDYTVHMEMVIGRDSIAKSDEDSILLSIDFQIRF